MEQAPAAVVLEDLHFAWQPHQPPLLTIPEFRVMAGEQVFLRGPSGSGKTTLLGLLAGVLRPQRGQLQVLGTELGTLKAAARDRFRADHMGYIFQMFNLLPYLSVVENALLSVRFSRARRARLSNPQQEVTRLLEALEIPPSLHHRGVSTLSVGQQQRVAAVRALLGKPGLLIADEPTSALDVAVRERFLELLFGECQQAGTTVIFVSHDPGLASLFPRVVELPTLNQSCPDAITPGLV